MRAALIRPGSAPAFTLCRASRRVVEAVEEIKGAVAHAQRREQDLFDLRRCIGTGSLLGDQAQPRHGFTEALAAVHLREHFVAGSAASYRRSGTDRADALVVDVGDRADDLAAVEEDAAHAVARSDGELSAQAGLTHQRDQRPRARRAR